MGQPNTQSDGSTIIQLGGSTKYPIGWVNHYPTRWVNQYPIDHYFFGLYIFNAFANDFPLPPHHEHHLPELLKLAEEEEQHWQEIVYNPEDPNTWVQMGGLWPNIRGKVFGTAVFGVAGTVLGHVIDEHDHREQTRQNEEKRKAYEQGRIEKEAEIARIKKEAAENELRHQQEMERLNEEKRAIERREAEKLESLHTIIAALRYEIDIANTTIPDKLRVIILQFALIYEEKIQTAGSLEEAQSLFLKFKEDLDYTLTRFGA